MSFISEILRNLETAISRHRADCAPSGQFRVIRDREVDGALHAAAGQVVFKALVHDYGLARADTEMSGRSHVAVTKETDGGYPLFTIPEGDLKAVSAMKRAHLKPRAERGAYSEGE
jgi:hypothetical protein